MTKATDLLTAAAKHMSDRAATYDKPEGERSMAATVAAYRAVRGADMLSCERDGWLFMILLKLVRFHQNPDVPHRDSVEDAIAYAALFGESALGGE